MKTSGAAGRVANIYARTLLELAVEGQTVEAIQGDCEGLAELLEEEADLREFLGSPSFSRQTKRDLVQKVFSGKVQPVVLNLLIAVVEHDRGLFLAEILEKACQLCKAERGYKAVRATVAGPMGAEERQKLATALAAALRSNVELEVGVDPAVLGGVILRYDDKVVDNSVRGRLTRQVQEMIGRHKTG